MLNENIFGHGGYGFHNLLHNDHAQVAVNILPPGFKRRVEDFWPHYRFEVILSQIVILIHLGRKIGRGINRVICRLNCIYSRNIRDEPCLVLQHLTKLDVVFIGFSGVGKINAQGGIDAQFMLIVKHHRFHCSSGYFSHRCQVENIRQFIRQHLIIGMIAISLVKDHFTVPRDEHNATGSGLVQQCFRSHAVDTQKVSGVDAGFFGHRILQTDLLRGKSHALAIQR